MYFVANRVSNPLFPDNRKEKSVQKPTGFWTLCNTETEPTGGRSRILYNLLYRITAEIASLIFHFNISPSASEITNLILKFVITSHIFYSFKVIKTILTLYVTANTIKSREKGFFIDTYRVQFMKNRLFPICQNYKSK